MLTKKQIRKRERLTLTALDLRPGDYVCVPRGGKKVKPWDVAYLIHNVTHHGQNDRLCDVLYSPGRGLVVPASVRAVVVQADGSVATSEWQSERGSYDVPITVLRKPSKKEPKQD